MESVPDGLISLPWVWVTTVQSAPMFEVSLPESTSLRDRLAVSTNVCSEPVNRVFKNSLVWKLPCVWAAPIRLPSDRSLAVLGLRVPAGPPLLCSPALTISDSGLWQGALEAGRCSAVAEKPRGMLSTEHKGPFLNKTGEVCTRALGLDRHHLCMQHTLSQSQQAANVASGWVSERRTCKVPELSLPLSPHLCSLSPPALSLRESQMAPRPPTVDPELWHSSPVSPCPLFPPYSAGTPWFNTGCSFAKHF